MEGLIKNSGGGFNVGIMANISTSSLKNTSEMSDAILTEQSTARILSFLLGTLYGVIIILSLSGNSMVVIAVLTTHKLKTITNYLLMSLAVADLTVTILVLPYALVYDITGYWHFGETFCLFWMSWDVSCCTASLQHLCAVSVDRYLAINDPLHYYDRMSPRKVVLWIIVIWINSFCISFLPIFLGLYRKSDHSMEDGQCFLDINQVYAVISASVSFYIPFVIMGCCYYKILSIALRQAQDISRMQKSLQHNNEDAQSLTNKSKSLASERKAIKTLGIIFGFFYVCWQPFFILYWIYAFSEGANISNWIRSSITWLGYINSAMNPVVYALNPDFRQAYKRIFRSTMMKCPCGYQLFNKIGWSTANGSSSGRRSSLTVPSSDLLRSRAGSRNYASTGVTEMMPLRHSDRVIDETTPKAQTLLPPEAVRI